MRSAVLRLPSLITVLMNFVTSVLWYSGSGAMSRFGISRLRGMTRFLSLLRALGAVFRSALHAALDADRVERAAHDVIADTRQILDAAAANQHQRVFLQVMADPGDVGRDLDAVGQPHARDLAQRRVRLLRRLGEHANADAALLRAVLQRGALRLADDLLAPGADELTDSRHNRQSRKCGLRMPECGTGTARLFKSAIRTPALTRSVLSLQA